MVGNLYSGTTTMQTHGSDSATFASKGFMGLPRQDETISRDEHRLKELSLGGRPNVRLPRRSQTHHDYKLPPPPPSSSHSSSTITIHHKVHQQPQHHPHSEAHPYGSSVSRASLVSSSTPRFPDQHPLPAPPRDGSYHRPQAQAHPPPPPPPPSSSSSSRRPPLGPPRRSHSVMDYEPMPHYHRPVGRGMGLLDLPNELHYAIFDWLDPIDATCLGLASKGLYAIHRRLNGKVPLSTCRNGPNELEWAWHLACGPPIVKSSQPKTPDGAARPAAGPASDGEKTESEKTEGEKKEAKDLAKLRVRGQAYCRKCGVCRCELHKHIQDWMGDGLEYCSIKERFGPVAPEDAKPFCYMSTPKNRQRCGRHRARGKVVLQ